MYASLGDITFENLKGFDSLNDSRVAVYAEHALIETKPRLQRTGSSLQELNISIKFHVAFCNPEEEYDALYNHMETGDVLPLIYGNGFYENDFVIISLERSVNQTDESGNYVEIQCDLALKEFYDPNKLITRQERDKLSAFAVDTDRPLPVGPPQVDNTLSAQLYLYQQKIHNETYRINQKFATAQAQINEYLSAPQAVISMGQQFVNIANNLAAEVAPMAARINASASVMLSLLTGNSQLLQINPLLQATLQGGNTAVTGLNSALSAFNTLPGSVTTNTQGQYCLDVFNNAKTANSGLQDAFAAVFGSFAAYGIFIAARQIRL